MSSVIGGEDLTLAWSYAANCSLYEEDPGPAELNIGSSLEPHLVSRVERFAICTRTCCSNNLVPTRHGSRRSRTWSTAPGNATHRLESYGASRPICANGLAAYSTVLGQWTTPARAADCSPEPNISIARLCSAVGCPSTRQKWTTTCYKNSLLRTSEPADRVHETYEMSYAARRMGHMTDETTHSGLRRWAAGFYPKEAAVELLIRALDGRLASPGCLWIVTEGNDTWIDPSVIALDLTTDATGNEAAVREVVSSLLHGGPVDLYDIVTRPDRDHLALILAALAHAGDWQRHGDALYTWPTTGPQTTVH